MKTASAVMYNSESANTIDTWLAVRDKLKSKYGEAIFKSWLGKLDFISLTNGELILSAPTRFIKEWIYNYYSHIIQNLWYEYDKSIRHLDIIVDNGSSKKSIISPSVTAHKSMLDSSDNTIPTEEMVFSSLDKRFTFENFVVGSPNELAYAAARATAESSKVQSESNPLFLYGGVGLGKTHLMHAIAWHIHETTPWRKVVYMSAEKFMYQFVQALRNKDIMSFKEKFRSVDVLMIDDVQFICGKDSTQEEFFHTFNALVDNNRQIVISCDRSPSDLEGIEERIRSRLGWGLVIDVHSTTYELRLGILESKVEQLDCHVPKIVLEFLASKITSNVRELEGALNKVVAHSTFVKKEINLENTQEILRDLLRANERVITIEEIQKRIAERYSLRVADMSSSKKLRIVARPRQIAMYLSKMLTPRSLSEIGRKFGGKDHTTVLHAIRKIEELCSSDNEFNEEIQMLIRMFQH
ncbi:MAG: chromosomal replication initiator protein DnaA [Rickettsiales endosymbiont of Dermacentor nuttalli]